MPNLMFIVNDSDFGDPRKVFNMDNPAIAQAMVRSEAVSKEIADVRLAVNSPISLDESQTLEAPSIPNGQTAAHSLA